MPVTFVTAFLDLNNIENRPNHKNTVFYNYLSSFEVLKRKNENCHYIYVSEVDE